MLKKLLSLTIIICFFLTTLGPLPKAHADSILNLPAPGTMVNLSPAYEPVIIKGLTVHKDNPFLFDFIVDVGQDRMSGEPLKKEGDKLIKYFLASLAIPDKDVWVNLSPYEKNRIIPDVLGQTDMGRDLLEQDYILKQITASLIYPEKQLGKSFWDKVYTKAREMYGTTQVPVNTFNKVWIMADRAQVFEHNQTVFVVDSHLKVMLEEDYLALQKHNPSLSVVIPGSTTVIPAKAPPIAGPRQKAVAGIQNTTHSIASQIVKQIILPQLEREVNTGKNFANLRQIFNSVILASWYKRNLKEALLNQVYADKSKIKGIERPSSTVIPAKAPPIAGPRQKAVAGIQSMDDTETIYQQYLKAYKKGVFNYIKEDINASNGRSIPRKYFSGGILSLGMTASMTKNPDTLGNIFSEASRGMLVKIEVGALPSAAMTSVDVYLQTIISFYRGGHRGSKASEMLPVRPGEKTIEGLFKKIIELVVVHRSETTNRNAVLNLFSFIRGIVNGYNQRAPGKRPWDYSPRPIDDPQLQISYFSNLTLLVNAQVFSLEMLEGVLPQKDIDDLVKIKTPGPILKERIKFFVEALKSIGYKVNVTGEGGKSSPAMRSSWPMGDFRKLKSADVNEILEAWKQKSLQHEAGFWMEDSAVKSVAFNINRDSNVPPQISNVTIAFDFTHFKWKILVLQLLKINIRSIGTVKKKLVDVSRIYRYEFSQKRFDCSWVQTIPSGTSKRVLYPSISTEQSISNISVQEDGVFVPAVDPKILVALKINGFPIEVKNLRIISSAAMAVEKTANYNPNIDLNLNQFSSTIFRSEWLERAKESSTGIEYKGEKAVRQLLDQYTDGSFVYLQTPIGEVHATTTHTTVESAKKLDLKNAIAYELQSGGILLCLNPAMIGSSSGALALLPLAHHHTAKLAENGGIDLNTSSGMQWKVSKNGQGVEMTVDLATTERIRHRGIDSLSEVIFRITPINNIWPLVGLRAPVK